MLQVLLNTEIISINQDYPGKSIHNNYCLLLIYSLGKGGHKISSYKCNAQSDSGICEIWSKDLSDYSYALAFYNSVS